MRPGALSNYVLETLNERGLSREQISELSPREVFNEYCLGRGLLGYGDLLFDIALELDNGDARVVKPKHDYLFSFGTVGYLNVASTGRTDPNEILSMLQRVCNVEVTVEVKTPSRFS